MATRHKQICIRLSVEEEERLAEVAQHYGLDRVPLLRMLVKHEFDKITQEKSDAEAKEDGDSEAGEG